MANQQYDFTYSRRTAAGWPPIHAALPGTDKTLCGFSTAWTWDFDDDLTVEDVECKRCRAIVAARKKQGQ